MKRKRLPSRKIAPAKARRMLREGRARGRKLTPAQRGMFGAAAHRANPHPMSETVALSALLAHVGGVRRGVVAVIGKDNMSPGALQVRSNLAAIEDIARELLGQVRRGVHTNTPLAIIGNPPVPGRGLDRTPILYDKVLGRLMEIRYRHADDGKLYKHDVDTAAKIHTATRGGQRILVIAGPRPLWADFDV